MARSPQDLSKLIKSPRAQAPSPERTPKPQAQSPSPTLSEHSAPAHAPSPSPQSPSSFTSSRHGAHFGDHRDTEMGDGIDSGRGDDSFTGAPVLRSIGVAAAPPPAQRKMTDDANVQPPFTALYTERAKLTGMGSGSARWTRGMEEETMRFEQACSTPGSTFSRITLPLLKSRRRRGSRHAHAAGPKACKQPRQSSSRGNARVGRRHCVNFKLFPPGYSMMLTKARPKKSRMDD
ncbi:hypothetical protein C8F01DRAFT_1229097 [Mycena amicta]|nr:hypothetical protein C8F01DRAFT_1229097 [Mycena amicta]